MLKLVLGGARSGKSSFALTEGERLKGPRALVATMEPLDAETKLRIAAHKKERGRRWKTFEEPTKIAPLIKGLKTEFNVIIVDCITLWLSNLMLKGVDIKREADAFIKAACAPGAVVIAVSNEVGLSIVPESALGRAFRDEAGRLNQQLAAAAGEAWLVVAGLPQKIK